MKITVLNPFTLDPKDHSKKSQLICDDESLTVQADAAASDINNIVKAFGIHGELPYGAVQPFYSDITDLPVDFQTAKNMLLAADEAFSQLPAIQRDRFQNNPQHFVDFLNDDTNYDEAVQLGFIPPKEEPPSSTDGLTIPKDGSISNNEPGV